MREDQFSEIIHFSKGEMSRACEDGKWENVDFLLMCALDKLREINGGPVFLNHLWATSGHSSESLHYSGEAADVVLAQWRTKSTLPADFPKKWIIRQRKDNRVCVVRPIFDQLILSLRIRQFGGVGVYPYWNRPGVHVDIRSDNPQKLWWRDDCGNYRYPDKYLSFSDLSEEMGKNAGRYMYDSD